MSQGVPLFSLQPSLHDAASDPRSVNTAVEFSKIRQALALVEAHVNYVQRSPTLSGSFSPSQLSFDTSIAVGSSQLKEDLSKSDLSEPEAAPGARGQSTRSGLYAGPTSAVSHLTSVRLLRVPVPQNVPDQVMSARSIHRASQMAMALQNLLQIHPNEHPTSSRHMIAIRTYAMDFHLYP